MKPKKYISIAIETSGSSPGKYSMLSLGACVVGNTDFQFYSELKPISFKFKSTDDMRAVCAGLNAIKELKDKPEYDPQHNGFHPQSVLNFLDKKGVHPEKAMQKYEEWVAKVAIGYTPIQVAQSNLALMFSSYYFDNFNNEINPFNHVGEDITSMVKGVLKKPNSSLKTLGIPDTRSKPHNALEDAIYQAQMFESILRRMRRR